MTTHQMSSLVQDVLDGNESALKGLAILRELRSEVDRCIKEIEPDAMDEADKYGEKTFTDHGFKFEKRAGGKMWDFKPNPEWIEIKAKLKAKEDELKSAWESAQHGNQSVDEHGAIIELPEVSYRKDSLVIKKDS